MEDLAIEDLALLCQKTLPDDTRAFEAIVTRYKKRVFATAYRLMGNREDAEDQAQEVFLKIYRNIGNLSEPATFESWMHRITVNICLDALEKRKRRPIVSIHLDDAEKHRGYDASSNVNTAKTLEDIEARSCLDKALSKLESNGRSAVILRDVEEMSYEEIADMLKVRLSAVKMRIHRARLAIQKLIEEVCPGIWRTDSAR